MASNSFSDQFANQAKSGKPYQYADEGNLVGGGDHNSTEDMAGTTDLQNMVSQDGKYLEGFGPDRKYQMQYSYDDYGPVANQNNSDSPHVHAEENVAFHGTSKQFTQRNTDRNSNGGDYPHQGAAYSPGSEEYPDDGEGEYSESGEFPAEGEYSEAVEGEGQYSEAGEFPAAGGGEYLETGEFPEEQEGEYSESGEFPAGQGEFAAQSNAEYAPGIGGYPAEDGEEVYSPEVDEFAPGDEYEDGEYPPDGNYTGTGEDRAGGDFRETGDDPMGDYTAGGEVGGGGAEAMDEGGGYVAGDGSMEDAEWDGDEEGDDDSEGDDSDADEGDDDDDEYDDALDALGDLDSYIQPEAEEVPGEPQPEVDDAATGQGLVPRSTTGAEADSMEKPLEDGQKKKRKRRKKGEAGAADGEKKPRKKRKKREKGEKGEKKKVDPNARRNIRKILSEHKLEQETLDAQSAELERQRRIAEFKKALQEKQMFAKPTLIPEKEIKKEKDVQLKSLLQAAEDDAEVQTKKETNLSQTLTGLMKEPSKEMKVIPQKKDASIIDISSGDDDMVKLSSDEEEEEEDDEEDDDDDAAEPEDMNNSGSHINDTFNVRDDKGRVLVNVGHPTSDPDIFLTNLVARCIKPHQIGGLRFLYDNLVECVNRFKTSAGFGCILAHSMGLGKTIQMIGFIDIFLKHTGSKTVLCIVPINTLANWMAEFNMWAPDQEHLDKMGITDTEPRPYDVYLLNDYCRTTEARTKVVSAWYTTGGVLLMGYEMYRLLSSKKGHIPKPKARKRGPDSTVIDVEEEDKNKTLLIGIQTALVTPGPDLVVCDEGHRIKNSATGISISLKAIRTKRRVVLTGYPLQNNLIEYWCMVDFVRPNFLGTKTEFSNMFERPIMNGQCADSTPQDVRIMRYRSHVLHSLLEGFVQRRGHTVLQAALPPKDEHVFMVRMSPIQKQLYAKFMESVSEEAQNGWVNNNPLKAFSVCCKIWNHPDILYNIMKKHLDDKNDLDIDTGEPKKKGRAKPKTEPKTPPMTPTPQIEGMDLGLGPIPTPALSALSYNKPIEPTITYEWANEIMKDYVPGILENGGKMVLLFNLIHESLTQGDKILVFSQSLFTLSLIEELLSKLKVPRPELDEYWSKNRNYFRLDGSTSSTDREKLINHFNKKNSYWLFLLSTRAGSLGVNLVGANRVVVVDASWNPCHDCQAICRVYRFGQVKPSHIYRLVTENTMERKIYDRQINKQGMSDRVVDELNPQNQFRREQVDKLLAYEDRDFPPMKFSDFEGANAEEPSLMNVLQSQCHWLTAKPFTHESLLIDRKELKLTMKEKRMAKQSYVMEKRLNVSYSRPSYSSYYPRPGGQPQYQGMIRGRGYTRPIASVKPMVSTPIPMKPKIVAAPQVLKPGVSVHQVLTTTEIVLPGTNTTTEAGNTEPKKIPSGQQVLVIRTPKGVYIRTPDGKIFAVRSKPQPNSSSPLDTLANTGANTTTAMATTSLGSMGVSVIRPSITTATTVIRPTLSTAMLGNKPVTIVKQTPGGLIRTVIPVTLASKIGAQGISQGQRVSAVMDGKQIRIIKAGPDNKTMVIAGSAVQNLTSSANTKTVISNSPSFGGGSMITKILPKPVASVQTIKKIGLNDLIVNKSNSNTVKPQPLATDSEKTDKNSSWSLPPIDLQAITLPNQLNTNTELSATVVGKPLSVIKPGASTGVVTPTTTTTTRTQAVRPKFTLPEDSPDSDMAETPPPDTLAKKVVLNKNVYMSQHSGSSPSLLSHSRGLARSSLSTRPSDIDLHELQLSGSSTQLSSLARLSTTPTQPPAVTPPVVSQPSNTPVITNPNKQSTPAAPHVASLGDATTNLSQSAAITSNRANTDQRQSYLPNFDQVQQSQQLDINREQSQQAQIDNGHMNQQNIDHRRLKQPNQGQLHSQLRSEHGQSHQPWLNHGQVSQTSMDRNQSQPKQMVQAKPQQKQHSDFSSLGETHSGQNVNQSFNNSGTSRMASGHQLTSNAMAVGNMMPSDSGISTQSVTNTAPNIVHNTTPSTTHNPTEAGFLGSTTGGVESTDLMALAGLASAPDSASFLSELTMDTDDDFLPEHVFSSGGDGTGTKTDSPNPNMASMQNSYNMGGMGLGSYPNPVGRSFDMFNSPQNPGYNYSSFGGGGQFAGGYNNQIPGMTQPGMSQPGMSQPGMSQGFGGGSMYPMPGMMQPGMYGYPAYPGYPYPGMMPPMPYYPMAPYPQYGQTGNMPMGMPQQGGSSTQPTGADNSQQMTNKNMNEMNQM